MGHLSPVWGLNSVLTAGQLTGGQDAPGGVLPAWTYAQSDGTRRRGPGAGLLVLVWASALETQGVAATAT